jgi:tripeptidyl-peptidase-1
MAVAEFQGQAWDDADLQYFTKTCQLKSPVTVARQVGSNHGTRCKVPLAGDLVCSEALLDIEYIKAVAGDIPLTSFYALKYSLLNWAKQLEEMEDVPLVHSVSYGYDERQTSMALMDAVNAQFMKLGARGVSILFASGDQGVYGRSGKSEGTFHPDFPAASPYVTAVGGTDFAQKSVIGAEKAWVGGGGGFSSHFAAPAYQQEAVAGYLKAAGAASKLPNLSHYNAKGRGYPDVSALAGDQNGYCIAEHVAVGSTMWLTAGTSASCPVVAGLFARLNALRAKQGMPPLGFLNPFIYKSPEAFNDVTQGKNTGVGSEGFEAIKGWDPATGFGTPNFPKMKAAALAASPSIAESAEKLII